MSKKTKLENLEETISLLTQKVIDLEALTRFLAEYGKDGVKIFSAHNSIWGSTHTMTYTHNGKLVRHDVKFCKTDFEIIENAENHIIFKKGEKIHKLDKNTNLAVDITDLWNEVARKGKK